MTTFHKTTTVDKTRRGGKKKDFGKHNILENIKKHNVAQKHSFTTFWKTY